MKAILDALKARLYATGSLTTAVGSRIYLDNAPANSQFPRLVYRATEATATPMFGGLTRYDVEVEFRYFYSNAGDVAIWTASAAVATALATKMTATGFDAVRSVKIAGGVPAFEDDSWSMIDRYRLTAFDT